MRKLLNRRKLAILAILAVVGAVLAPNGFFSGHRTITLEGEIFFGVAEVYTEGAAKLQNATLVGEVRTVRGLPIAGAMITAFSSDGKRRITAYSHTDGSYKLPLTFAGELPVRARTPYFEDVEHVIDAADGETSELSFTAASLSSPEDLSASLTASAHAATLKWPTVEDRSTFVSQCTFCHQIGNSLTRRPRNTQQWKEVVDRMEGYLAMVTDQEKESITERLSESFTGEPIEAIQTWDVSPALANARVEEWVAGDGLSFIHDADVGRGGRLYGVDEGHDVIWTLDRVSGRIESVALPDVDLPVGGKFSGLALPIGIFTGKHGPHSLAESADGRFWITNALSSTLMAYTPASHRFETFDVGADSLYMHTIRLDHKERLWFTFAASNQLGRFDPATRQLDLLDLPSNGVSRWLVDAFMPSLMAIGTLYPRENLPIKLSHHKWARLGREILEMPYGIDVNPQDGSIWYAKLYANKIGRVDAETFEVEEFDSPLRGPRRPRFAPNGMLWIPAFDDGALMSFDPASSEFRTYPLPTLAPGEYETPYALNVHSETGVVWLTSNMSDRIFSFDPQTETFTSYPLPTRVSFLRDLVFTGDDKICSSHSNLPAYATEGGLAGFMCLVPGRIRGSSQVQIQTE